MFQYGKRSFENRYVAFSQYFLPLHWNVDEGRKLTGGVHPPGFQNEIGVDVFEMQCGSTSGGFFSCCNARRCQPLSEEKKGLHVAPARDTHIVQLLGMFYTYRTVTHEVAD